MDRDTYLKQHKEIEEKMTEIQKLINKGNLEENAGEIGVSISSLAGVLSVHLSIEDKFMYPKLAQSEDEKVRSMSLRYKEQMGGITAEFNEYKKKFNTKQTVLNNAQLLKSETDKIFAEIRNRIKKEEGELYLYI